MSKVKHLNSENFSTETSQGIALIDFWAEWCGPCKMLGPVIDEIASEVSDEITIAKVDVDKAQNIASQYNVRSIPAIFILKDGAIVNQLIGMQDKQTLLDAINNA